MKTPPISSVLALCRASNLPTVWMNVLAACALSGAGVAAGSYVLLALSLSAFYCGGMALNDLCDLQYDRVHQPFRPIPAGRIGLAEARLVTVLLFVAAFVALAAAPHGEGLAGGLALLVTIAAYDRIHKRHAASVLLMAMARLLVYVVTALAVSGVVSSAVWWVGGLQALYVLAVTVVARYESRTAAGRYSWPVIPWMIALMPLIDGVALALLASPGWLLAALVAVLATRLGQRYVRGD